MSAGKPSLALVSPLSPVVHRSGVCWRCGLPTPLSVRILRDAKHMARDVHNILLNIAQEKGGKSESEAQEWVAHLQARKRYQQDVWS